MPKRDGTGPFGNGPMSGKGFGYCTSRKYSNCGYLGRGLGLGYRRGYGRGTERELLEEQIDLLKERLENLNK